MARSPRSAPTDPRRKTLRSFLGVVQLEDRVVPAGDLFYYLGDERIELQTVADEFIVKGDRAAVDQLTSTGLFHGYQVSEEVRDGVFVLGNTGSGAFTVSTPVGGVAWTASSFRVAVSGQTVAILDEAVIALDASVRPEDYFAGRSEVQSWRPLLGTPDQFVVTLAKGGEATLAFANAAHVEDGVAWATPNFYRAMRQHFVPNDTLYPTQWHLNNTGTQIAGAVAGADVNAQNAWDLSTGTGVTIAITDDGIERTHPDLLANMFVNPGEIAGNGIDDDGNGYADDVTGWSFATNSPNPSVTVNDEHGTSVAGVAAGVGNNSLGVTGSAYNARILPVQMFNGGVYVGDAGAASAIYYAAGRTANGLSTWNAAQVINASWGGGAPNATLTSAFTWASNSARSGMGVVSFISSGNGYSSAVSYPANLSATLSGVIAVGASNQQDRRSEYSNFGSALDVVAPSSDIDAPITGGITTTDRTGSLGYNTGDYTNNTVANGFGGTSSASPLAAGVGALILSLNPNLTAAQVKSALRATADKVGGVVYDANGFNSQYGYGRINAFAALQSLGMQVVATTPPNGGTVTAPPAAVGGYRVDFNFPFSQVPTDIDLTKVTVNGISPSSYTVIDADTLQFNFAASPVTAQGVQSFALAAGAVKRLSNGETSGAFSGAFRYDVTSLSVTGTTPTTPGGVFTLPAPFTYDVVFNEAIAAGSVGTGDLSVSQGTVTGAVALNATTARYTISGIATEGALNISLLAGAVTDAFGNPNAAAFNGSYQVDIGSVPFPVPLAGVNPPGSLVYDRTATGIINFAGDVDEFTINLDAGQSYTIYAVPNGAPAGLSYAVVEFVRPDGVSDGAYATGLRSYAVTQSGVYRFRVSSGSGTGGYTLRILGNADIELEGPFLAAGSNDTPGTAQFIDFNAVPLNTTLAHADRLAVLGTTDTAAGYTVSSPAFSFTNISATGSLVVTGDDSANSVAIPFSFNFYGTNYTSLFASTNGLITFGSANTAFSNGSLASTPAQAAIAPFWDDLYVFGANSRVLSRVIGAVGSRQLIVQWDQVNFYPSTGSDTLTFQVILSEGSNAIRFNYLDLDSGGQSTFSATAGIKAAGATSQFVQVLLNGAPNAFVGTGKSTVFAPALPSADFYSFNATAGQRVTLAVTNLAAGNVDVQLIAPNGTTVLASGVGGATNLNEAISNFLIGATGTFFVRVTGDSTVPYSLVLTRDAAFDTEGNNTLATAQPVGGSQGALGYLEPAGNNQEGFETGDFSSFPWTTSGNANWFVTTQSAASGTFSARSGLLPGNSVSTSLSLALTTNAGNISFARRVSSEGGFDFLRFFIDGVQQGAWSGEVPFSTVSFPVTAGAHTFTWTYSKDSSVTVGLDAAFLDDIMFPVAAGIGQDWYAVTLAVGETVIEVETTTPAGGPGEFVNTLNPKVQVFNAGGIDITGTVTILGDGRNEKVRVTGLTAGATYYVKVTAEGGTTGEYFVGIKPLRTPTITTKVDDALPFGVGPDGTFSIPNAAFNGWRNVTGAGYLNDHTIHTDNVKEAANNFANWTIRVTPDASGYFELFTTWVARPQNATNATYQVYEGTTLRATVTVNQQVAPNDAFLFGNTLAESLGRFQKLNPATTYFSVRLLTLGANGDVVADGVFDPPAPALLPAGTSAAAAVPVAVPPAVPVAGQAVTVTAGKATVAQSVIPVAAAARREPVSVAPWTATGGEQFRTAEVAPTPNPVAVAPLSAAWSPVDLTPRPVPAVRGTEGSIFGSSLTDDTLGLDLWPAVGLKTKRPLFRA